MEEDQARRRRADCRDRGACLVQVGHPRRDDEGKPRRGCATQQREVRQLAGHGQFQGSDPEIGQDVGNAVLVERRSRMKTMPASRQWATSSACASGASSRRRSISSWLSPRGPASRAGSPSGRREPRDAPRGTTGTSPHRPRPSCSVNEAMGHRHRAVVVHPRFRDHQTWLAVSTVRPPNERVRVGMPAPLPPAKSPRPRRYVISSGPTASGMEESARETTSPRPETRSSARGRSHR